MTAVGDVRERICYTFEWRIPVYSICEYALSPTFQFGDAAWKLGLSYCSGMIWFYVIRQEGEQDTQVVTFKLSARVGDEREHKIFKGKFEFTAYDDRHLTPLKEEELIENEVSVCNLTVTCVMYRNISIANAETISSEDGQECIAEKDDLMKDSTIDDATEKCSKLTGVDKLLEDLQNLLSTEEDSDVSIMVKDRLFKVHKNILRIRSSVFNSMFKHDMAEKSSGAVEIDDCDPEAFKKFLHYLYTGRVEDLSNEIVLNLYFVADKYDAEEVKENCIEFMKSNLSVETFSDVVALALEHSESALLETATEFFCKNIKKIIVTAQWQSFLEENTVAANELHIKALENYVIPK